jgi:CDGSH-type Zn-finger protein
MTTKVSQPIAVDVVAGETYFWCSCGLSQTMPLCDKSHKGKNTGKKALRFVAEESNRIYLCGCTLSEAAPMCDGSHLKSSC